MLKKLIETNRKKRPVRAKHNLDVKLGNICLILIYNFFLNNTLLNLEFEPLDT